MHSSNSTKNQILCSQTCIFIQIKNSYSIKEFHALKHESSKG